MLINIIFQKSEERERETDRERKREIIYFYVRQYSVTLKLKYIQFHIIVAVFVLIRSV